MCKNSGMEEPELSPGRRERKKRATRLALKAAALDLISERGYNNVTVEDIANAVDVSVRTFFNYFTSKEAAVVGSGPEMAEDLRAQLIALPPELSPLGALQTLLMGRLDELLEDIDMSGEDHAVWHQRFCAIWAQPEVMVAYTKHSSKVERALVDAVVERLGGEERFRPYASVVTTCAFSAMRASASLWAAEGGAVPLDEVAQAAFAILAHGFQVPMDGPGASELRVLSA